MRLKRILAAVILVPLAVAVVALSVANRHVVSLSLDPFNGDEPAAALAVPLYILLFSTLAVGIVVGGVGTWLGQGRWRRQARTLKREQKGLKRDNERFRSASTSAATALPAPRRDAA